MGGDLITFDKVDKCFWLCLFVRKTFGNEQICMKVLPEVCLGPMNNPLNLVNDPDYKQDLRSGSRGGGLQSLTDCIVTNVINVINIV